MCSGRGLGQYQKQTFVVDHPFEFSTAQGSYVALLYCFICAHIVLLFAIISLIFHAFIYVFY